MYATISSAFLNWVGFQGGGPGSLRMFLYDRFQYSRHVSMPASGLRPATSAAIRSSSVRFQLSSGESFWTPVTLPWLSRLYSVTVLEQPMNPADKIEMATSWRGSHGPNENKMSDGWRESASLWIRDGISSKVWTETASQPAREYFRSSLHRLVRRFAVEALEQLLNRFFWGKNFPIEQDANCRGQRCGHDGEISAALDEQVIE